MFCKIHRTKMNSDEEMAQLSRDDVRLLRIVMQELNVQAKQFSDFCIENQKWHEQHHANIGAIMEATQFFASALHNKLGVPEFALKLRQDAALLGGKENLAAKNAASGSGSSGAHERVMKARFDDDALAGVMHSLDEKQFAALRPDSAEVLLAHVGKFLRAASDEDFLLGALTLQELARTFADIFAHTRNQAHCQLALRALQASTDRVHAINTPLFGVADAKELVVFLRDSIH